MNTLTLTLSGMQNIMDGEINKKLERIMRILEWQAGKIQLLEREVIVLKESLLPVVELDIEEDMEVDIEEEVNTVREKKVKKTRGDTTDKMKPHEEGLYDRLCKWRRKHAVDDNVSAYLIFNNDQLERIAKHHRRREYSAYPEPSCAFEVERDERGGACSVRKVGATAGNEERARGYSHAHNDDGAEACEDATRARSPQRSTAFRCQATACRLNEAREGSHVGLLPFDIR